MTTYTEPTRPFEALLSESNGSLSRADIIIADGAGVLAAGTVIGKITTGTSASATAFDSNTGTGTVGTITVSAGAKVGTYKVVVMSPDTNAGAFQVEGPDGKILGTGNIAAEFDKGGLKFTISDATDFVAGDGFDIVVAAGSGKWTGYDDANTDGSQVAAGILMQAVDASEDDVHATAIIRLAEVKKDMLQWITGVDGTAKTKAYADLLAVNIVAL